MTRKIKPEDIVTCDSIEPVYLATLVLRDDRGARIIANATLNLWRNIGVVGKKDNITIVKNGGTITFFVDKPMFDVKCHLEAN